MQRRGRESHSVHERVLVQKVGQAVRVKHVMWDLARARQGRRDEVRREEQEDERAGDA